MRQKQLNYQLLIILSIRSNTYTNSKYDMEYLVLSLLYLRIFISTLISQKRLKEMTQFEWSLMLLFSSVVHSPMYILF